MNNDDVAEAETVVSTADKQPQRPKLVWNDGNMQTTHANAVNVVTTVEEFMLFFGINQSWNPESDTELKVELSNRIVLNPHAAKRLSVMLDNVLNQYEQRFGTIKIGKG